MYGKLKVSGIHRDPSPESAISNPGSVEANVSKSVTDLFEF